MSLFETSPMRHRLEWFTVRVFLQIAHLSIREEEDLCADEGVGDDEAYLWLLKTAISDQRIDEMLLDLVGNIDSGLL